MGDAVSGYKLTKGDELSSIVGVEISNGHVKVFLDKGFELDKGFSHLGFLFQGIKPSITGVVVNKAEIIFVVIN